MKTLDELRKKTERKTGRGNRYFSLKENESAKIWFLQELTEDAKNFNDTVGTADIFEVVSNPNDFRKSARVDSLIPAFSDWRPKTHLLINIAVEDDEGNWEVKVLDQKPNADSHVAGAMIDFADEYGTLLDRPYKITRKGSGKETAYRLVPLMEGDPPAVDEELHELEDHYRFISVDEQEAFFLGLNEGSEASNDSW